MNLAGCKVLLTGATGGIGRHLALALVRRGATTALAGRSNDALGTLADEIRAVKGKAVTVRCDLAQPGAHAGLVREAASAMGGLDVLINNAGVSRLERFSEADAADIARTVEINVAAPMLLTHAALGLFLRQGRGHIVNIGSALGSLAFPCFAAYSGTKFALRGFSEALRREVGPSGIRVLYVAPRATATPMNGAGVRALYAESGTAMDAPERVADIVVDALERDRSEVYIGWPERFFLKLNAVLPRLVDRALERQGRLAARYAERGARTGD